MVRPEIERGKTTMTASNYSLVAGSKFDGKGQAKLVFEILAASPAPMPVKAIATALEANPAFKTRQTSERIAAYYVCVFKKAGIVTASAAEVPLAVNENEDEVFEIE